jgi:hypothetical protein
LILSYGVFEINAQKLIPFHLENVYILIDAQVNPIKGKFIFDTGTPINFMLNNNLVPRNKGSFAVKGGAGSGQLLDFYSNGFCYEYPISRFRAYLFRNLSYDNAVFDLTNLCHTQSDENKISLGYFF